MKLALALVLVSTIAACTVDTTSKTSDTKDAPPASSPSSPSDEGTPAPSGSVPADVIGQWTWITSAGAQTFTFNADGTYADDVFLDGHPGDGCGTEFFTHRGGVATFSDATVTLRPSEARRKKVDSCSDEMLADDAIDSQEESFSWRRATDERGLPVLVLTRAGEGETTYAAGGQ